LLLFAAPFVAIGSAAGYLARPGHVLAFLVFGLGLIALGIVGMASIGVIIYPVGVALFSFGIGRSLKRPMAR